MQKTKIKWPWDNLYTCNPVVGCKHNCGYCYARKISSRFKMIPKWEDPQYFPHRLDEPRTRKKPTNIFVGSMCDLFGDWVPKHWIEDVIHTCAESSHHTFIFLTKNPKRYQEFEFPENCWLGATITKQKDFDTYTLDKDPFVQKPNKTFLSIEPLLGMFDDVDLYGVGQIIVGAMSGPGAVKPKREWISSIKHDNIFWKDSMKPFLTQDKEK